MARGAPALGLDKLSTSAIVGSVFGVAGVTIVICVTFLIPYFHRRLVMEDYTIRWYHVFLGPALMFRGPVPPVPENVRVEVVQDFYRGTITKDDLRAEDPATLDRQFQEAISTVEQAIPSDSDSDSDHHEKKEAPIKEKPKREPFYKSWGALWQFLKGTVLHGLFVDVLDEQNRSNGSNLDNLLAKNVKEVHAYGNKYDNKTEYLYSMLQVFTATTASFAHGYDHSSYILIKVPMMFPMPWVP
jgi:solute carrier family 20 (sodium-dependent phosphate transporter)